MGIIPYFRTRLEGQLGNLRKRSNGAASRRGSRCDGIALPFHVKRINGAIGKSLCDESLANAAYKR